MKIFFLILATAITLVSVIPYLRDILKGTTKPNLVSWITWTLLTGIATAAQISAHEYVAAIFTGSATIETTAVVVFGLRHGFVKYSRFDVVCQLAAIVGIILWQIYNSPALAVIASVTIDFIGALPTIRHSWLKPHEETWSAFALAALGAVFGILALSTYNWVSLPYAVYIVGANLLIVSIIILRTRNMKNAVNLR
jgi:hypothetical protein